MAALAALASAAVGCGAPGGAFVAARTPAEFDAHLAETTRPVMVEFYKSGCPACGLLAPTMSELSTEYADRAAFVKVERSHLVAQRQRYGVSGYPTVLLFIRGKERARWVNQGSKAVYREALDAAIAETSGTTAPAKR